MDSDKDQMALWLLASPMSSGFRLPEYVSWSTSPFFCALTSADLQVSSSGGVTVSEQIKVRQAEYAVGL